MLTKSQYAEREISPRSAAGVVLLQFASVLLSISWLMEPTGFGRGNFLEFSSDLSCASAIRRFFEELILRFDENTEYRRLH